MEFKFDKGFFGRLFLLVGMTFLFYMILKPTPLDDSMLRFGFLSEEKMNELFTKTERFKTDLGRVTNAANEGNEDALYILFEIQLYSKGEVAKHIPPIKPFVEKHPEICRRIVMGTPKLKKVFENLIEIQKPPSN